MKTFLSSNVGVSPERQRGVFDDAKILELKESIVRIGLLHPIVVRRTPDGPVLVAGERRMKAIAFAWGLGQIIRCGDTICPEGSYPCVDIGDLSPEDAYEAELEENIRRQDLTWQEQAAATAKLMELRSMQAAKRGEAKPTAADLAVELRGSGEGSNQSAIRTDLLVSRHLADPDVKKAKTAKEALKVIKQKEERRKNTDLATEIGKTFNASVHGLINADCLLALALEQPEQYDCIITDPPYGMGADEFGDSGGRTVAGHFYDDSYESWKTLINSLCPALFRIAKPQSHAYLFCDVERFAELKLEMATAGWKVFRTPIIWHNPTSMRAPWPDQGPQRKYQVCLYAVKGSRPVLRLAPDLITFSSDENLGHPAQKPVDLYKDLLTRSCRPGDRVLDPFCGSGPIFPAAHDLKLKAVGIEMDENAYGIAAKRLSSLFT